MRDDPEMQDAHSAYSTPDWLMHVRQRPLHSEPPFALAPGTVFISRLAFRYAQHLPPVFDNLSLGLRAGEMAALVGPRGCGKSTLVQLIQGLLIPNQGLMMTCGRRDSYGRVREARVAVVARDPMLFGGSVAGNLMMADPKADFASIVRACQRAGVHEMVMSLPAAYDTEIGERGMALKPGQRQCISVARALLRNPDILILDEGFCDACPDWSARLARALRELKGQMTVIVACRRLPPGLALDTVINLGGSGPRKLSVVEGGTGRSGGWDRNYCRL